MKYNRYVSALLAVSLLLSPTYLSTADDLDNELQDVQGQIDESRSTQASWQAIITDITEKLKAIQAELDEATRKLQAIKKEQDQVNLQIKQLQEEIQKAEVQLRARQAILNKRVRVIYMHGQLSYIEVILGANSFSDFANRLELLKRIIRSDFNLIQEIQQRKAAIEAKKVEIEKEKARLDELASEAQKVQDEVKAKKAEQQRVLAHARTQQEEIQKAEVQLRARQAILNKRVRVIYMHGQLSYIEVILGANSFSDFANRLELLKRIIRSDFNLIQEIQQRKAAIEAKKVEIEKEKARLDELASEAQKVQDEVKAKKAEQQRVLAHARTQQDAAKQMEADLIARSNEIRQMIQSRMQQNSGSDQIVHGNGTFIWPCNGPITSPFGYRTHPIFGTPISIPE